MNNPKYRDIRWYDKFWTTNPQAYGDPNHDLVQIFSTLQKNFKKDFSVLDIGAGNGRYSIEFAKNGANVTAVELSSAACTLIELQKNTLGLKNICIENTDYLTWDKDDVYDLVFSSGLLDELSHSQQHKALLKISKLTSVGSFIVIKYCLEIKNRGKLTQDGYVETFYNNPKWEILQSTEESSFRSYPNGVPGEDALRTGLIVARRLK